MSSQNKLIIIVGVVLVLLIGAGLAWMLLGQNRTGEEETAVSAGPDAPMPTVLGTTAPDDPSAIGGADTTPTPAPELEGSLDAGDLELSPPPSLEELLAEYPELAELVKNLDLSSVEEEELEALYAQLLKLYEEEGLEGLQSFMVESGLLDALNLDPNYLDFFLAYEEGGIEAAEKLARDRSLVTEDDALRLVFVLDTEDPAEVAQVEAELQQMLGAQVLQKYRNELEVGVPLARIEQLASSQDMMTQMIQAAHLEHVIGVRVPDVPLPSSQLPSAEGPGVTGADAWHAQGYTGAGVRVGIVDGGFGNYQSLLGSRLPSRVTIPDFQSADTLDASGSVHGTACAEVVHAMAPDADLYFYQIMGDFEMGLRNAVDWMLENNVRVVSMSASDVYGPMDGTGPFAQTVRYATERGILWVNSAGNSAKAHYTGTFTDADGDGYHEFGEGQELLRVYHGGNGLLGLSWDDRWQGGASENYDLYLYAYDGNDLEVIASGRNAQSGGAADLPYERIHFWGQSPDLEYYAVIKAADTSRAGRLSLLGNKVEFGLWMKDSSLTTPGDAAESLTVGATYWSNDAWEDYSSMGPTSDGRTKPDIAAPAGVSVDSYPSGFSGTSASTPHVAGAAALVWGANPDASNTDVRNYLLTNALDLGATGPDMAYGQGRLSLPAPTTASPEPDPQPQPAGKAVVSIWDIRQEHNVYVSNIKGMKVYVSFDIESFRGRTGTVLAEFYDQNGNPLPDGNGQYATSSGYVGVWDTFTPSYDATRYTDYELFLPYTELETGPGEHNLNFKFTLWDNDGWQLLRSSDLTGFRYTESAPERRTQAVITNIMVDHNVTRDGVKGMDIEVAFTVDNFRDREGMAVAYFYFGDSSNRPLKDFNDRYRDNAGNVAIGRYFTPGYDSTRYDDLLLFMPYSELHMESGYTYDLKFYVELWNAEDWVSFTESDWQYFTFTAR